MKKILIICLFFLLSSTLYAQNAPGVIWNKMILSDINVRLDASQIIEADNGDYVLTGTYSTYDIIVCRINPSGEVIWMKKIGGDYSDSGMAVTKASDEGFVIAASTVSNSINGVYSNSEPQREDIFVFKISNQGNIVWQTMLLEKGTASTDATAIISTGDGGYIVAGNIWSDSTYPLATEGDNSCYIVKLNSQGVKLWERSFGGPKADHSFSLAAAPDGNFLLAGDTETVFSTQHNGKFFKDFYLVKFNTQGDIIWQRNFGGYYADIAYDIDADSAGNIILFGVSGSEDIPGVINNGLNDFYIVKLNSDGNILWQKMYGKELGDAAYSGCITSDGGCIAAGCLNVSGTSSWGSEYVAYFIKLDKNGNPVWELELQEMGPDNAVNSVIETRDGSIVAVHKVDDDIYLIKITN